LWGCVALMEVSVPVWIQLELDPQESRDVEIFSFFSKMLLHGTADVRGVGQNHFAGAGRKFRMLAHSVRMIGNENR